MNTLKLKSYTDAGHGWIAVKRDVLQAWGILDQVTHCSFQSKTGKTVYLEEDCDATLFMNQAKTRGVQVEFKNSYKEVSPVRNYPRFQK